MTIRLRDQRFIVSQINTSPQTVEAYESYLAPQLAFLKEIGGATLIQVSDSATRALCVFLGQEVERRRGKTQLLEAVTDSLILWALEGTDPDKLMTRDEIIAKIEQTLPSARTFVRGVIDDRLGILASKDNANGREIRHHTKEDKYCLVFTTRELIFRENAEDEALKASVSDIFRDRARQSGGANLAEVATEVCHRTLNLTFERQGLEIAAFIGGDGAEPTPSTISENMDRILDEMAISRAQRDPIKAAALPVLRQSFYDSTEIEREYLLKLSRTYTLLFVLKNEPRIVEYFRGMSSNFVPLRGFGANCSSPDRTIAEARRSNDV